MAQRRLRRREVIDAAIAFINEHGIQSLTMRRLGASLGVEAMALYRHVPSRDELIAAAVGEVVDGLFDDELMQHEPKSWEEYLQCVAHALRNLALSQPKMFPLLVTQPPDAPWLRPPLRSIRWVEHFLSSLKRYDFSDDRAVACYKAFTSFILGDLLLQVSALDTDATPAPERVDAGQAEEDLEDFPTVSRLRDKLAENHADREFSDGLDELIERIRTTLDG
ncbi:TetR family transcriptional regulator [Brevibacterium permense]|uniref:TetR/AcrR family transcriptional regulator n=1 Tax=Brevibacterium permense TaxID=234834 RepID=UPI0021D00E89|nr:TetR family transcriptional regulator [Brevibacterium permense]MCU4296107.1 TetR family transcriptional regulator [Brevibacterium permense]